MYHVFVITKITDTFDKSGGKVYVFDPIHRTLNISGGNGKLTQHTLLAVSDVCHCPDLAMQAICVHLHRVHRSTYIKCINIVLPFIYEKSSPSIPHITSVTLCILEVLIMVIMNCSIN
jgi:hypothetical protein